MIFLKFKFRKSILITLIGLFCFSFSSFSQAWQWARSGGGTVGDQGWKTCTDPSGNIYVAGEFSSISITIGTITIPGSGSSDVFIAKYDNSGNVLWARGIGGTGAENIGGIATSTAGDIAVFGSFRSPTFTVAPFSVSNATTSGTSDVFLARFSSIGVTQFLNAYGNAGDQFARGCDYSSGNTLWITGDYTSTNFVLGSYTVTNSSTIGFSDVFFAPISTGGTPIAAYDFGGANSSDYSAGITTYSNNAVYITGRFGTSTTTIGTSTLTSYGVSDVFLTKYNGAGGFQWAVGAGATNADEAYGIDADPSGNILITGYYSGSIMTLGTTTLTAATNTEGFLAKYNSSGVLTWAQAITGPGFEYSRGITTDASSNVFVTGNYGSSTLTFSTITIPNTTTTNMSDAFVAKYNSSGVPQWATHPIGSNAEFGKGICTDAIGNVYSTGNFNIAGATAFGTTTLTSVGADDFWFAKIGCLTTNIIGPLGVCAGNSTTLTATGATTYSWNTGATTTNLIITPTVTTSYTATGTTGACVGTPAVITVTFLPASMGTGSNLNLLCKQKAVINATCNPASPTSVIWTPTTNLSSSTVLTPTVTGGFGTTTYSVTVNLNNGCVRTGTVNVSSYAQTPDVCQVTVDSLGVNNEIYWDKTLYPQADSFIVYREVSTSVYSRIAAVSRTAFSMYTDTNRSIGPANGDPNLTYYKYKLQIKDSCGNVSPLSLWHETIFIQDQMNGNFNWNMYAIEATTSTPVSNYNLKRRSISTGTETLVISTTGGLATDPAYASFWPLNVKWFVDALGFNCNATAKFDPNNQTMVVKTKTKSNQSNDKLATGISAFGLSNIIKVYPNPANNLLNIDMNGISKAETIVEIQNTLGQIVYATKSLNQHLVINTSDLGSGVYFVTVKQNGKTLDVKKVIIDK